MPKSRRRRSKAGRKAARRAMSRAAAPRGIARLTVADLNRELRRRQRGPAALHRRRAKLLAKIEALDAEILAAGGTLNGQVGRVSGGGRIRPKNDTNLIDALRAALKGKTLGVAEAVDAVQKAGYRTSAANFKTMVDGTLLKKKFFRRVERGRYTAK